MIDPAWLDRPPPTRVHHGPPLLYDRHGLKALAYPDFIEVLECNPRVDKAGFIIGLEVPEESHQS